MKNLLLILLCFPLLVFSQDEKRLALVIGNANYNKGELKNPVNDALLIAETLKKLEFDVILDTNIANKRSFKETIREFGNRRPDYDVAFVYYAGHGIQVGSENYLLPTKEVFASEYDVQDYAVSVQDIMRYLTGMSNQVNILILDACRDNPFEGNWNATRSLKGGGLAKIPPPTGSLIAFSTDAGNTAADGDGKNTVYCESLCKNMLLENTSLDQVFRNVRADVLQRTNKQQRPVESSQLTGNSYYLVKSDYSKDFVKILKFIDDEEYFKALEITNKITTLDPTNKRAHKLKGDNYYALKEYEKALEAYNKAIEIDSLYVDAYFKRSVIYEDREDFNSALNDLNSIISIEPDNHELYNSRGIIHHYYLHDTENGLVDYNKSIELSPTFVWAFVNRAVLYKDLGQYDEAIADFDKGEKGIMYLEDPTAKKIAIFYENTSDFYLKIERYDRALSEANKGLEIDPDWRRLYDIRADIYYGLNQDDNARSDVLKFIDLLPKDALGYYQRGRGLWRIKDYKAAIIACNKAIEKYPESIDKAILPIDWIYNLSGLSFKKLEQYENALEMFAKAIEINPREKYYYNSALSYYWLEQYDLALEMYEKVIELNPRYNKAYNDCGYIYYKLEKYDKALEMYSKAIEINNKDNMLYANRGLVFEKMEQDEKALKDYSKGIELNPEATDIYITRAKMYFKLSKFKKAISDCNKSLETNEKDLYIYLARGVLFMENGYIEEAKRDFLELINLDANNPQGYYYLGLLYYNQSNYTASITFVNNAIIKFKEGGYDSLEVMFEKDYFDLRDIYVLRGNIYKNSDSNMLMCEDYKNACDLGNCELFNKNCK